MAEEINFILQLKDLFSGHIDNARAKTEHLDKQMHGLKDTIREVGEAFGVAFGIYEGVEFLKDSAKDFIESELSARKLAVAVGVNGGLASDLKDLTDQSEELQKKGIFSHDQTEGIQTMALQFGLTTEQVKKLTPVIEDFASATGQDLRSAYEGVIKGSEGSARALKLYGIDLIDTKDQTAQLENIVGQLNKRFEGQNEIIRNTTESGALAGMANEFKELKEQVGKQLLEAFHQLVPYIQKFMELMKAGTKWIGEHHSMIKALFVTIVGGVAIVKGMALATAAYNFVVGIEAVMALTGATAAQLAMNLAMEVAPWALAVAGIAAVVYALNELFEARKEVDEQWRQTEDMVNNAGDNEIKLLRQKTDELMKQQGLNEDMAIQQALINEQMELEAKNQEFLNGLTASQIQQGFMPAEQQALLKRLELLKAGGKDGKSIFELIKSTKEEKSTATHKDLTSKTENVTGTKNTTINIQIGKLVEGLNFVTNNMQENAEQIKEIVVKTLIEAVNDSQILAGQ